MIKFANEINLKIKFTHDSDASYIETNNIINWAETNRMNLNYKKTGEMVVRDKITRPLPAPRPMIVRISWLKILGVTFQENPSMWDMHLDELMSKKPVAECTLFGFPNTTGFLGKSWIFYSIVLFYQY